jgi:uncharacterized protein (DUF983 family)
LPPTLRIAHEKWPPDMPAAKPEWDMPGWGTTIWRGMRGFCPHCGKTPIFDGYLAVHSKCAACAAPLGDMPADDTPPYIAMLAVLHVAAFCVVLSFTFHFKPNIWTSALAIALLVLACLVSLRMAKGAVIGILLKLGLRREGLKT